MQKKSRKNYRHSTRFFFSSSQFPRATTFFLLYEHKALQNNINSIEKYLICIRMVFFMCFKCSYRAFNEVPSIFNRDNFERNAMRPWNENTNVTNMLKNMQMHEEKMLHIWITFNWIGSFCNCLTANQISIINDKFEFNVQRFQQWENYYRISNQKL